ncbi:MAG: hypothetical protein IKI27_07405 [Methanobrevibacter sp.]|nr:hypothetical protein [Methanobrevibacter sp.]MBR2666126.1 hypothetical protein [Methanobrevibacter sp.]MBR7051264.1 hypothetical protein [Methanobrevibacter sp.]
MYIIIVVANTTCLPSTLLPQQSHAKAFWRPSMDRFSPFEIMRISLKKN